MLKKILFFALFCSSFEMAASQMTITGIRKEMAAPQVTMPGIRAAMRAPQVTMFDISTELDEKRFPSQKKLPTSPIRALTAATFSDGSTMTFIDLTGKTSPSEFALECETRIHDECIKRQARENAIGALVTLAKIKPKELCAPCSFKPSNVVFLDGVMQSLPPAINKYAPKESQALGDWKRGESLSPKIKKSPGKKK